MGAGDNNSQPRAEAPVKKYMQQTLQVVGTELENLKTELAPIAKSSNRSSTNFLTWDENNASITSSNQKGSDARGQQNSARRHLGKRNIFSCDISSV